MPPIKLPPLPIIWIGLATAFSLLGDQALYALLPLYFEELGLIPFQVGIILSANRWIRLVTNQLAENSTSRFSPKALSLCALFVGSLLTAYYAFSHSFTLLLLARLMWGLCFSFIRHAGTMTVVSMKDGHLLGQKIGYYEGFSRMGSITGLLFGAILFDWIGFSSTFLIFAVLSLLAVPLGMMSPIPKTPWKQSHRWAAPGEKAIHLWGMLFCGFTIGIVGQGLLISTLGFVLESRYGSSATLFGFVLGISTINGIMLASRWVMQSIGAPFLGALVDHIGLRKSASFFFLSGALALAWLSYVTELTSLFPGILIFFACGTTLQIALISGIGKQGPKNYAKFVTASDIGSAAGPVLGWTLLEFIGNPNIAFIAGICFYAIAALVSPFTFKK
ncbi:MAG: MFS transporter [SAR324 cluster bacterium]|nr:MFS transporter [SAR324 cluster bacterium]